MQALQQEQLGQIPVSPIPATSVQHLANSQTIDEQPPSQLTAHSINKSVALTGLGNVENLNGHTP